MKVLYYEVSDAMVERLGGKYFRYTNRMHVVRGPEVVGKFSRRIWEWDLETDQVRYIKNRDTGTMTAVDRNEFMLIQLRAEEY